MEIIAAKEEHIGLLVDLNKSVQDIHINLFPDIFHETNREELLQLFLSWFREETFRCYIAYNGSVAVGYIFLRTIKREKNPFSNSRRVLYVDQICVEEKHRKSGIGKSLIKKAIRHAKENNIDRVELDYWTKNFLAGKAFRALGFETYNEKMVLKV